MAIITGVVTEDDRPAERTVRVYERIMGALVAETRSAADGSYTLEVPAGTYDIIFQALTGYKHIAHGPITVS